MPNYSGVWSLTAQMQSLKSGTWQTELPGDLGICYGHYTGTAATRRGVQYILISTTGNATDYVDLTDGYSGRPAGFGSSTRGGIAGGNKYNDDDEAKSDNIEYHVMSNGGNLTSFGNLSAAKGNLAGLSNGTRAVFNAGQAPGATNVMEYITVATLGDVTDFGDLSAASLGGSSASGTTRGMISLGNAGGSLVDTIEYITVGSTGNTTDFGNCSGVAYKGFMANSSVRMCVALGAQPSIVDTIDYFTIASTGNGTDFGDLTVAGVEDVCGTGNATRGVRFGGVNNPTTYNIIDYITFGSTGDASDFGDLTAATKDNAAASNCHGGLS
tara:strand:+ start:1232 stop:2212 length:981 start_codon:yes stop_codon:yes gene_type:complete